MDPAITDANSSSELGMRFTICGGGRRKAGNHAGALRRRTLLKFLRSISMQASSCPGQVRVTLMVFSAATAVMLTGDIVGLDCCCCCCCCCGCDDVDDCCLCCCCGVDCCLGCWEWKVVDGVVVLVVMVFVVNVVVSAAPAAAPCLSDADTAALTVIPVATADTKLRCIHCRRDSSAGRCSGSLDIQRQLCRPVVLVSSDDIDWNANAVMVDPFGSSSNSNIGKNNSQYDSSRNGNRGRDRTTIPTVLGVLVGAIVAGGIIVQQERVTESSSRLFLMAIRN